MKAAKGKKKRNNVKKALADPDKYAEHIYDYINNFKVYDHKPVIIHDGSSGKEREIIVPRFNEHVVHHMLVITLHDLLSKGMYDHSYSSIPGRGLHKCSKVIRKFIDKNPRECKYFLKMDIKKFFNSIDHDVLKSKFKKHLKCNDTFLNILFNVIDSCDKGLPIGFYTSHWFANWLLTPLDHYIKEELHASFYVRYMDDMVVFGSNKRKLHKMKLDIERYFDDINLRLKENWQVCRFNNTKGKKKGHPLSFIGFKFYRNKTILRKNLLKRMKRVVLNVKMKGKFTIHDARRMMSYLGWIKWSDTFMLYKKYIAPYIGCKQCKKYISRYDRTHKMHDLFEGGII